MRICRVAKRVSGPTTDETSAYARAAPETIAANPDATGDKRPDYASLEGEENPQSNDLARLQVEQGALGDVDHGGVYAIEQLADKVFAGHAWWSFRCRGVAIHSLEPRRDPFQGPLKPSP
ncbi:MAG: hypothetical protein AB7P18_12335 [Candidatus Binatia bacterium]